MIRQSVEKNPSFSFSDPAIQLDPFGAYYILRSDAPVYIDPQTGNYVLTCYDDVRKAVLNVEVLKNSTGTMGDCWGPEADAILREKGWRGTDTLVSNDPPSHKFYRSHIDKVFTPAKVKGLEPRIEEILDGLIDRMIDKDG